MEPQLVMTRVAAEPSSGGYADKSSQNGKMAQPNLAAEIPTLITGLAT